ncbi:MAG: N-acetylmuramoyl-L-alanine amidase, partial [Acidimicrobiia bacterium]
TTTEPTTTTTTEPTTTTTTEPTTTTTTGPSATTTTTSAPERRSSGATTTTTRDDDQDDEDDQDDDGDDGDTDDATTTTTAPAGQDAVAGVPQPDVVTRAQWGADESLRKSTPPKYAPITKLFVHHTVTSPGATDPDPASTVRAIYAFHTRGRGWDDIGYHFLVDHTGRIYEGRWARDYAPGEIPTGEDENGYGVVGAHASGHNFGTVAVSVIGDFTDVEPTSEAMASVERMLAWKADRHDINVTRADPFTSTAGVTRRFPNLAGHRDVDATACPGNRLYPQLPAMRERVARAVIIGNSPVKGYWTATADGRVLGFGLAEDLGSVSGMTLNAPIVGMEATPSGEGYWLMGGDGGIFTFGDADFHGSTGGLALNQPVVRMAATRSGKGYWLVASDGGVFTFGDARFYGSTGGMVLNRPVVGMAPTPSGEGYWLVASDGGVFSFGDAVFWGSTGNLTLNSPVVAMAAAPDGYGYWLVAEDGGVFTFDVPFRGSIPGLGVENFPGAVQLRTTTSGNGYYVADRHGGVVAFGDARAYGADASQRPPKGAVDLVLLS